jgi:hypothetical protein
VLCVLRADTVTRLTAFQSPGEGGAPFNRPMGLCTDVMICCAVLCSALVMVLVVVWLGVAFDPSDESCRTLFVADTFGERIRRVVLPAGEVSGVAESCRVCGNDCTIM